MAKHRIQRQKGLSLPRFLELFGTEENFRAKLFKIRWPDGFTCPRCSCTHFYTLTSRNLYQCKNCKHQTSLISGTIFESSKLPLTTWFLAIYFITQSKDGVSGLHLRRLLGISVNAGFRLKQKIQHMMKSADDRLLLENLVELDDGSDSLYDGRRFRALTFIDQYTREAVAIEVSNSITGHHVCRVLDWICELRSVPEAITVDHGPKFTSSALDQWAYENNITLDFIRPGKPIENAHIESLNSRFRDEFLNENVFASLRDAREKIEAWRNDYNQNRPHSGINNLTPYEFAEITRLNIV